MPQSTNEICRIAPTGSISAANVAEFRKQLQDAVDAGARNITIDLKDVDIIDSKGLAVFIVCHRTLQDQGGNLTVETANPDLKGLFHVMRLDEHFTVKSPD